MFWKLIKKVHYNNKSFGFNIFGIYQFITGWNKFESITENTLRLVLFTKVQDKQVQLPTSNKR